MRLLKGPVSAGLCSLALASGCMTKTDGERLVREAEARDARLSAIENDLEGHRSALEAATERATEQVERLEAVLEEARGVLTRNSADLGSEVESLGERLAAIEGELAEVLDELETASQASEDRVADLERRVRDFARRAGIDTELEDSEIPEDIEAHYTAAVRAHRARQFTVARGLLRAFVERYPDDARADDAQHMIGRSYLDQNRPQEALRAFAIILRRWDDGDAIDETLFYLAEAFYRLHACNDARGALQALVDNHPDSPHARHARARIREIRRAPAGYCTE